MRNQYSRIEVFISEPHLKRKAMVIKAWQGWEGERKDRVAWLAARSLKYIGAIPGQSHAAWGAQGWTPQPHAELAHAAAISWAKGCGAGWSSGLEDFTLREWPCEGFPSFPLQSLPSKTQRCWALQTCSLVNRCCPGEMQDYLVTFCYANVINSSIVFRRDAKKPWAGFKISVIQELGSQRGFWCLSFC